MQSIHRLLGTVLHQYVQGFERCGNRGENLFFLVLWRAPQYVIDHLRFVAGMADADPQAPEISTDMGDRIAQAVVATVSATELETCVTGRQIQFVVNHQRLGWRDLQIVRERANRQAAAIHISGRLEQRDLAATQWHAADVAVEARVTAKPPAKLCRQRIDKPEAGVVTREQVLGSRITETDDDLERRAPKKSDGVTK